MKKNGTAKLVNAAKIPETNSFLFRLNLRGVAQLGSARDLGSRGRRFKSCRPDHYGDIIKFNEASKKHFSILLLLSQSILGFR